MPRSETEAMQIAFDALRGHDRDTENRVMLWLSHRLRQDRRGEEVRAFAGPAPSYWRAIDENGDAGDYDSRDEALEECYPAAWGITEVVGTAAVHQEFVVAVPVWLLLGGVSYEHRSFKTCADAEAYVAAMTADQHKEPTP